jgi:hypothetical protein
MKLPAFIRFFCVRVALFFLPIAVLFSFPLWTLWMSNELMPVDEIVKKQQYSNEPVLVGLAYSNPEKYFKLRSFLTRQPKVVVFGNSHVMSIREDFFGDETFYNAAVGGSRLPDFKNFVDHIPEGAEPRVLIAGFDPFFAKPDFDWSKKEEERFDREAGLWNAVRILGVSWKKVYEDYFHKKISVHVLSQAGNKHGPLIGLEAIMDGNGFQKDGSYFNKKTVRPFSGVVQDYSRLKSGESFDAEGIRYLEDFLEVCSQRNIYVIGILPPVRRVVYEQLRSSGYRYWEELPQKLEPIFSKYGFSLYDFSDPSFYGGNDDEFYDDFHASEAAYRRVIERLTAHEKSLSKAFSV